MIKEPKTLANSPELRQYILDLLFKKFTEEELYKLLF